MVKIFLKWNLIDEKSPFTINPAKDGIFDAPLFHHPIIPWAVQKHRFHKIHLISISFTIFETTD